MKWSALEFDVTAVYGGIRGLFNRKSWVKAMRIIQIVAATLLHRGSYMSAHVLLNLLNELGKRDKM